MRRPKAGDIILYRNKAHVSIGVVLKSYKKGENKNTIWFGSFTKNAPNISFSTEYNLNNSPAYEILVEGNE